ncbi:protein FAM110C [Spea bombifrons]|uniref:protein FAM110C n=1 Tax=Spea bombifrons TaxID=233779 RepID=UPI00234A6CE2|nr:protein FAM110C [Spea bombifrons]
MPTEIMNAVRMQPISELQHHSPVVPIRLLTRGPEYLRRQMETGTPRATLSAVERLAADKAKYVKSHQVTSGGSSSGSQHNARDSSASESSSGASSQGSSCKKSQPEGLSPPNHPRPQIAATPNQPGAPIRRGSGKRQMRPDSLVIYRQKSRGDGIIEQTRASLVRRFFQGNVREKTMVVPLSLAETKVDGEEKPMVKQCQDLRGTGLHRSQSDISSRYSRSFSEFETFFKYCGLEPEVIEELGKERFSSAEEDLQDLAMQQHRIRSVSVATSESGFSHKSGEGSAGGLQEDEQLSGQLPTSTNNTSVVERNARIIKWLYSCKRAKEARGGSPDLP